MMDNTNNNYEPSDKIVITQLCDDDAKVLEAILRAKQNGTDSLLLAPNISQCQKRIAKSKALLALLDKYNQEDEAENPNNNNLTQRTMAKIRSAQRREYFAENGQLKRTRGFIFHWREVITSAAIVLIATSLLLPVLSSSRAQSLRQACMANLASVGKSIISYASDHQNTLPRTQSAKKGSVWWDIGNPDHSNSAQLYKLVKDGYATPSELACPGNEYATTNMTAKANDWPSHKAVSYSYQNQFTNTPIRIDKAPQMTILADKNPLILKQLGQMTLDMAMPHTSPSTNHGYSGQNVLKVDGSVTWKSLPIVSGDNGRDNIWLMNGVSSYNGTESPVGHDSFLVP